MLLGDFGLAKAATASGLTTSRNVLGSVPWNSPELFEDDSIRVPSSDIWAMACLIVEVRSSLAQLQTEEG